MMNSEEIIKILIKINDDLKFLKNKIDPNYKKFIIDKIDNKEIKSIEAIPDYYRDDFDVMISFYVRNTKKCLNSYNFYIYYLGKNLSDNKTFFLNLCTINNDILKYLCFFGENITKDLGIMEKIVNKYPNNIIGYTNNKDFIIKMVKSKPEVYKFLGCSEIFYDKDIMEAYLNKIK